MSRTYRPVAIGSGDGDRRRRRGPGSRARDDRIRIRVVRRTTPDLRRLGRAVLAVAMANAAAEAAAQADSQGPPANGAAAQPDKEVPNDPDA